MKWLLKLFIKAPPRHRRENPEGKHLEATQLICIPMFCIKNSHTVCNETKYTPQNLPPIILSLLETEAMGDALPSHWLPNGLPSWCTCSLYSTGKATHHSGTGSLALLLAPPLSRSQAAGSEPCPPHSPIQWPHQHLQLSTKRHLTHWTQGPLPSHLSSAIPALINSTIQLLRSKRYPFLTCLHPQNPEANRHQTKPTRTSEGFYSLLPLPETFCSQVFMRPPGPQLF